MCKSIGVFYYEKDISKADSAVSKACYYDTQRGADSEKKY